MEGDNQTCSLCSYNTIEYFCICEGLPVFCDHCKTEHELTCVSSFALPLDAFRYIDTNNRGGCQQRLMTVKHCLRYLNASHEFSQCKADLEALFRKYHRDLDSIHQSLKQKLDVMETAVNGQVAAVVSEITANAYKSAYLPTTPLAREVWDHCRTFTQPNPVFFL